MKTIAFALLCLTFSLAANSQDITSKVVLKKGEIIKMSTEMTSSNTQSMMGEPSEMKTSSTSYTEFEVKEVSENGYVLTQTLKTMKLDFDGFGQKINFDSDSKEKSDNPFVKMIGDKIGVPEEIKISLEGKEIEDTTLKTDAPKEGGHQRGGGKGMMKMMNMGGGSGISGAFLIIPKDAVAKGGWEENTESDGLKTRKKYTLGGMMGNLANVSMLSQTKGETETNRGGFSMTTKVNNTSEDMFMVNIETGKVQMHTSTIKNNSKMVMNDKETPSTGTTTVTTSFE